MLSSITSSPHICVVLLLPTSTSSAMAAAKYRASGAQAVRSPALRSASVGITPVMLLAVSLLSKVWLKPAHSARLPSTAGGRPALTTPMLFGVSVTVAVGVPIPVGVTVPDGDGVAVAVGDTNGVVVGVVVREGVAEAVGVSVRVGVVEGVRVDVGDEPGTAVGC